jgi:hypothetical protein
MIHTTVFKHKLYEAGPGILKTTVYLLKKEEGPLSHTEPQIHI